MPCAGFMNDESAEDAPGSVEAHAAGDSGGSPAIGFVRRAMP